MRPNLRRLQCGIVVLVVGLIVVVVQGCAVGVHFAGEPVGEGQNACASDIASEK